MKLVGLVGNDFNVNQLEMLGATVNHLGKFDGYLIATPYNAYIQFDSFDDNRYRPYLQLDVEVNGGRGYFGNDVNEFIYREDDRLNRSVRYDFTDKELSILVEKGLYQPDFKVPALFTNTHFEIPMELDITEIALNENRLIHASFDMISDLKTNSELSGYNLVEYFDYQPYEQQHVNSFEEMVENEFESKDLESDLDTIVNENEDVVDVNNDMEENVEHIMDNNVISKVSHLDLSEIIDDEIDVDTEIDLIVDEKPVDKKNGPEILKSSIRDMATELDASKANTEDMAKSSHDSVKDNGGLTIDV